MLRESGVEWVIRVWMVVNDFDNFLGFSFSLQRRKVEEKCEGFGGEESGEFEGVKKHGCVSFFMKLRDGGFLGFIQGFESRPV